MKKIALQLQEWSLSKLKWKFEERRMGESSIGLWRMQLAPKRQIADRRLVVIPGLGDNSLSWMLLFQPQLIEPKSALGKVLNQTLLKNEQPYFDRFTEIVVFCWPGFPGRLEERTLFNSGEQLLESASEVLFSLDPHTVIAHSMGGWVAGYFATQPKTLQAIEGGKAKLEHLILASPSGLYLDLEDCDRLQNQFSQATEGRAQSELLWQRSFFKAPKWLDLFKNKFFDLFKKPEMSAFLKTPVRESILNNRLKQLKAKVTLIWGDSDQICLTRWSEDWKSTVPAPYWGGLHLLKSCGHNLHLEKPGQLLKVLKTLLQ